jgi:hypothetical protein
MITEYSTKKPVIHGLLLLDCWEPQVKTHFFKDKYYVNLIENLNNENFTWVVNSASRLKIDLSDIAMANTFEVCKYQDDHPIIKNLLQYSGNEKTSTLITRYILSYKKSMHIMSVEDFVWFCSEYMSGSIQNWLVAGLTWQMCTHSHALGLPKLAHLSKQHSLNFYATDYSFCTMTEQTATLQDFEQDSLKWELIKDFGYRLLPQDTLDKY